MKESKDGRCIEENLEFSVNASAVSAPEVSDLLMPGRILSHPRRENQLQLLRHGATNGMLHQVHNTNRASTNSNGLRGPIIVALSNSAPNRLL